MLDSRLLNRYSYSSRSKFDKALAEAFCEIKWSKSQESDAWGFELDVPSKFNLSGSSDKQYDASQYASNCGRSNVAISENARTWLTSVIAPPGMWKSYQACLLSKTGRSGLVLETMDQDVGRVTLRTRWTVSDTEGPVVDGVTVVGQKAKCSGDIHAGKHLSQTGVSQTCTFDPNVGMSYIVGAHFEEGCWFWKREIPASAALSIGKASDFASLLESGLQVQIEAGAPQIGTISPGASFVVRFDPITEEWHATQLPRPGKHACYRTQPTALCTGDMQGHDYRPHRGELVIWGAAFTFDNDGVLRSENRPVGRVVPPL